MVKISDPIQSLDILVRILETFTVHCGPVFELWFRKQTEFKQKFLNQTTVFGIRTYFIG